MPIYSYRLIKHIYTQKPVYVEVYRFRPTCSERQNSKSGTYRQITRYTRSTRCVIIAISEDGHALLRINNNIGCNDYTYGHREYTIHCLQYKLYVLLNNRQSRQLTKNSHGCFRMAICHNNTFDRSPNSRYLRSEDRYLILKFIYMDLLIF